MMGISSIDHYLSQFQVSGLHFSSNLVCFTSESFDYCYVKEVFSFRGNKRDKNICKNGVLKRRQYVVKSVLR